MRGVQRKRYKPEALRVTYQGRNINDVLSMTVDEAADFFSDVPQIQGKFSLMKDIGLGYIRIGQPATTFSGGEAQRLKICAELSQMGGSRKQRAGISKPEPQTLSPAVCISLMSLR